MMSGVMGDLSLHFDRREFACHGRHCCGGAAPVSERLICALEELRRVANEHSEVGGVEFNIDSGFRCLVHNREVGSKDSSYHCLGMAADVRPIGITVLKLVELVRYVPDFACGGVGVHSVFVHLDVRFGLGVRW